MTAKNVVAVLLDSDEEFLSGIVSHAVPEIAAIKKILSGNQRESRFVQGYLAHNDKAGQGNGLTIGSYLAYQLSGSARNYSGRYKVALENALEHRLKLGLVLKGVSKTGRVAYYTSPGFTGQ